MTVLNEERTESRDLEKEMESLIQNAISYFNLGALLTGLCVSALFIFITFPESSKLTFVESFVIFLLTITTVLFIASVLLFSIIPIRVTKIKEDKNLEVSVLEKKVNFEKYQLNLGRKSIILGLALLLISVFYLIVHKDPDFGTITYITAFIVFFMFFIITIINGFRAGLHKIKSDQIERKKNIRDIKILLFIFIIVIVIAVLLNIL